MLACCSQQNCLCFFHMQHKQMGSAYAFPNWKVMIQKFYSMLEVHLNCSLIFWHLKTKRHSCLVICRKEKYIFIWKQRCQLSCMLYGSHSNVTINMFFRSLFWGWESLTGTTLTCCFASRCLAFFGSTLKKIELWQWVQCKNP